MASQLYRTSPPFRQRPAHNSPRGTKHCINDFQSFIIQQGTEKDNASKGSKRQQERDRQRQREREREGQRHRERGRWIDEKRPLDRTDFGGKDGWNIIATVPFPELICY
eukprot:TRINITY_DN20873_c0_g1_i3.p2 TRINITY_DN20873_c0_g1~~TRINITY_DN20873_c0_g1_i3.p2  ORF type:complete len:109 (+),score=14.27 TRINITY_DN20873_c0_g1_i3:350-676(+)